MLTNWPLISSDSTTISVLGPLGVVEKGSSIVRRGTEGGSVKLDASGVSEALRLVPDGRDDGAVLKDEATDVLSELWGREGTGGDAVFIG